VLLLFAGVFLLGALLRFDRDFGYGPSYVSLDCGRAERAPEGGQNVKEARDRIFRWLVVNASSGADDLIFL